MPLHCRHSAPCDPAVRLCEERAARVLLKPRVAALIALLLTISSALMAPSKAVSASSTKITQLVNALALEVETLAARTRPPHWPMRRSCLYYALAGKVVLDRHGIETTIRFGAVDYLPGTRKNHPIDPHAWLETDTHFIDYATLPRLGLVTQIPRDRVVTDPANVRPGETQVLALPAEPDRALAVYLRHHARRFRQWLVKPAGLIR